MGGVVKKIGGGIKGAVMGKKGPKVVTWDDPRMKEMYGDTLADTGFLGGPAASQYRAEAESMGVPQTLRGDLSGRQEAINAMRAGLSGYSAPEESAMFAQAQARANAAAQSAGNTMARQSMARGQGMDPIARLRAQQYQAAGGQAAAQNQAIANAQEVARRRAELAAATGNATQQSTDFMNNVANQELTRRQLAMQQLSMGTPLIQGERTSTPGLAERLGGKIGAVLSFGSAGSSRQG